jgi:hypothetical protein
MPLPLLLMLAAAQVTPTTPINVTGHAWAPFISPMGEPFRAKTVTDDTLADWFYQADRNRDGVLTLDEMQADADRFELLDSARAGRISLAQLEALRSTVLAAGKNKRDEKATDTRVGNTLPKSD